MNITTNSKGKDYIIGDLHGCYDLLMDKLGKVGFDEKKDRLFSVGDLIDRGPKSLECLSLVFEPWFFSVRGNHEQDMFDSMESEHEFKIWSIWRDWVEKVDDIKSMIIKAQDKMPFWITLRFGNESIGIVHAEPPDRWDLIDSCSKDMLLTGRDMKWIPIAGIDKVYVGHTGSPEPYEVGNTRHIDTTAFHTGILTMEELWR